MNHYNNNSLTQADLNKSFAAFADLDQEIDTKADLEQDKPLCFGEFASENTVFPML